MPCGAPSWPGPKDQGRRLACGSDSVPSLARNSVQTLSWAPASTPLTIPHALQASFKLPWDTRSGRWGLEGAEHESGSDHFIVSAY